MVPQANISVPRIVHRSTVKANHFTLGCVSYSEPVNVGAADWRDTMQLITGTWTGALISEDGRLNTPFFLSQPATCSTNSSCVVVPAMSIAGSAPTSLRLLEGARNVLVGLAEAVPDPNSGALAQVLLDMRVLGDRLVGRWLRRDVNGVMVSAGDLVARRSVTTA